MKKILSIGFAFVLIFVGASVLVSKSVRADDGSDASSTPDVVVLSDDAALSSLTVSVGTLSPAFDPGTTAYTDVLPSDTTDAPLVAAITDCVDATETITQADGPTGTATVTVTAQDGTTVQDYSVTFSLAPAPTSTTDDGGDNNNTTTVNSDDNSDGSGGGGGGGGNGSNLPLFSVIVGGGPHFGGPDAGQVLGASTSTVGGDGGQTPQDQLAALQAQWLAFLQQYLAYLLSHGGH